MHDFISAFLGGALLGLSAVGYLYVHGKIAGISGLVGQLFNVNQLLQRPAFWFLLGLFTVPFIYGIFVQPEITVKASPWMLIIAGLLVGFGTRLGSGCTSGHGICGIESVPLQEPRSDLGIGDVCLLIVFQNPPGKDDSPGQK